jgi:hypothetical protein
VSLFELAKAVAALAAAREYFREHRQPRYECLVLLRLADATTIQGDLAAARTILEKAARLAERQGSLDLEARARFSLAGTWVDEDLPQAKRLVTNALQMFRQSGAPPDRLLRIKLQLGLIDKDLGLGREALPFLLEVEQEARTRQLAETELIAARAVGDLLRDSGDLDAARTHLAGALLKSRELAAPEEQAKTLEKFALVALAADNIRLAFVCGAVAYRLFSAISHPWSQRLIASIAGWLEYDETQKRTVLLPAFDSIFAAYADDNGKALTDALLHADLGHEVPYAAAIGA